MNNAQMPFVATVADMLLKNTNGGIALEFGVHNAYTINSTANILTKHKLFGFDSFEGLPEKWRDGFEAGCFNLDGQLPQVEKNVVLYKGLFTEAIPKFKEEHADICKIDLLHIDCDLYSSTKDVFNEIYHLITADTIIVFDELVNYPTFENHEMLALYETLIKYDKTYKIIATSGERVALRIIDKA